MASVYALLNKGKRSCNIFGEICKNESYIIIAVVLLLLTTAGQGSAQTTILSETFTAANNATSGTNWYLDMTGCPVSSSRYFKVISNRLEARETDCDALFYSNDINISNYYNVSISIDLAELGNLSASDRIQVLYSIDGGTYINFATNGNRADDFTSAVATQTGLSGNTVKIKIIATNNGSSDYYHVDNILVRGNLKDNYALSINKTNGVCNVLGSINLVVTPDSIGGFSYIWSNGRTTQDISGLVAGVYSVTTTNYHGRTMTASTTITDSSPIISISGVKNVCPGGSTTLTATGGVSYVWSTGATGTSIAALTAGNYRVTGTDALGCAKTDSITIGSVNNVSLAVQSFNENCINQCNGRVETTPQGGNSPYTYIWNNSATTQNITNVCSGQYRVTVTDNQGCTATSTTLVNASNGPIVALTRTNVYCISDCSGTIDLTMLQGQEPFTFSWSDGPTTQDRSGLCMGNYCVTVSDASGCSVSACSPITEYSNLSVLFNTTDQDIGVLGSATANVYGGTPPYTYLWSNFSTAKSITNLQAGVYSVSVTDNAGVVASDVVIVNNVNQIKSGAFIVNMGVVPQTIGNGLKPYGMIYDLVLNYNIPIKWIINRSKSKDGVDFVYNGYSFRGGPFIIEAEYRSSAVNARIAYWQTQGVVGVTTTADIVAPVFETITGFSNLIVDQDNESLVIPYFTNAGIPSSIYSVGLPSNLNGCHDTYVLPHADPTWAEHSFLRTFNTVYKGNIWSGCHAVSMLEGIFNPSNPSQRMNFLSTNGLQCYSSGSCGGLINESHNDLTGPYTYNPAYNSDPIMQFMGDLTPSTENGSEDWYIPVTTGAWNSNTAAAITTADGSGNRKGVKLVYGPGYNNPANGTVMYEAGHTSNGKGSIANQVAAQRAFFNFIIMSSIDKRLDVQTNIPSTMVSGESINLTASATTGSGPYTYEWTSNCAGTFNKTNKANVTFTSGNVAPQSKCVISVIVTDNCGRRTFVAQPVVFLNTPPSRLNVSTKAVTATHPTCFGLSNGSITATTTGGTSPYTYLWNNGDTARVVSNLPAGSYLVTTRDVNGCTAIDTQILVQPTLLVSTGTATNVSVPAGSDGSATITPTGGTAPYTYLWSNGRNTQTITALTAATYSVTVTDAKGCQTTKSIVVTQPCTCIASGNWSNAATWSGICSGGGGKYPGYLDDITIRGYQVVVDSTHTVKSLLLRETNAAITKLSYTNSNSLNILQDFSLTTIAGGNNIEIEIDGSAKFIVNGNFKINHARGTNITIKLNSLNGTNAKLLVNGDLDMTMVNGSGSLLINTYAANDTIQVNGNVLYKNNNTSSNADMIMTMGSSSRLIVAGNVNFSGVRDQNMELILNNSSVLELGGSILRNASPSKFGKITMNATSSLVFNGSATQLWERNTGNTDNNTYLNVVVRNTSNTSPQVSLAGPVTVSGTLTMQDGNIGTGANMLILTNTSASAITGHSANSYVVGQLRRYIASNASSYDFPLGYGGVNEYYWAKITNNYMLGPTYLTAKFGDLPLEEKGQPINVEDEGNLYTELNQAGIWTIDPNIQPITGSYAIEVNTQNFQGLINGQFRLIKRPTLSGKQSWNNGNVAISLLNEVDRLASTGKTKIPGLTSFSDFGIGQNSGGSLPIDLVSFDAKPEGEQVRADWIVSMEINNDYFTIERSLDGLEFEPVATVKGAGSHSTEKKYFTYDEHPEMGLTYYRLRQTDFDGKSKAYDMVSVTMTSSAVTSFDIYPNPNKGVFTIQLETEFDEVNVMVFNNVGQMVFFSELLGTTGKTKTQLDLGDKLATGIYFVKIGSGKDTYIKQMVIE